MGSLGIPGVCNFRLDGVQFRKVPRRDRHDAAHKDERAKASMALIKVTHVPY